MSDANNIRGYLKIVESTFLEYVGKVEHPEVSYQVEEIKGKISKITVFLRGFQSARFTLLGRKLKRIEWLEAKVKKLREETKAEVKELAADWFHAEDAVSTRVINTIGFLFELTKDPKPSEVVKYAKVLEEMQQHLTPELIAIQQGLIKKHTTLVQKSPALKATDKRQEYAESAEAPGMDIAQEIDQWGANYDHKLDQLKAMLG